MTDKKELSKNQLKTSIKPWILAVFSDRAVSLVPPPLSKDVVSSMYKLISFLQKSESKYPKIKKNTLLLTIFVANIIGKKLNFCKEKVDFQGSFSIAIYIHQCLKGENSV